LHVASVRTHIISQISGWLTVWELSGVTGLF